MSRGKTVWVRSPEQIEALTSPVRQSILDRIEAKGACSVKELAASLNRPPDSLYYHVKTLVRVGLLVESGSRQSKRRDEALYDLCARRWHIAYEPDNPDNAGAVSKVTAGILRQAERDFRGGLAHPRAVVRGAGRNLWSLRLESKLTRSELREVNHHLEQILSILRKPERGAGGQLCAISWVIAPLEERQPSRRQPGREGDTPYDGDDGEGGEPE